MTYCNSASNLIEITFLFSVYLYDGAKSVGIGMTFISQCPLSGGFRQSKETADVGQ